MKKILVPTDFSATADKALDYAIQIAKKSSGEIILLHVCTLPMAELADDPAEMKKYNHLKLAEANKQLFSYKGSVTEPNVTLKTIIVESEIVEGITEVADNHDVDLILMGTQGASGIKALVMGSHTSAVVAATRIPVIAVPSKYTGGTPKSIVLALEEDEDDKVLSPVFELRNLFNSKLKTLTFTSQDAAVVEMRRHDHTLTESSSRLKTDYQLEELASDHIFGRDFNEALEIYTKEKNVNLVVMITHRKNLLQRLFRISMTRKMTYSTDIPLLCLHA